MFSSAEERYTHFFNKLSFISFIMSVLVIGIHLSVDTFYKTDFSIVSKSMFTIIDYTRYGLASLAVPFFFIKSGFLFFRNIRKNGIYMKIRKRLYTIGIPYVIWNITAYLFDLIITNTPIIRNYIYGRKVESITLKLLCEVVFLRKYHPFNWFLETLLVFFFVSPIFLILLRRKYASIIFLIIIFFSGYRYVFLFVFGAWLAVYKPKFIIERSDICKKYIFLISIFFSSLGIYLLNNSVIYIKNQIYILLYLLGLWAIWRCYDIYGDINAKNYYNASFLIYESQIIVASSLFKLFYVIFPKNAIFMSINFFITILFSTVFVCCIYIILRNKSKLLLLLLCGGR